MEGTFSRFLRTGACLLALAGPAAAQRAVEVRVVAPVPAATFAIGLSGPSALSGIGLALPSASDVSPSLASLSGPSLSLAVAGQGLSLSAAAAPLTTGLVTAPAALPMGARNVSPKKPGPGPADVDAASGGERGKDGPTVLESLEEITRRGGDDAAADQARLMDRSAGNDALTPGAYGARDRAKGSASLRAAPALSRDSERGEGEGRSLGSVPSPAPDPLALYPGPSQETFERWHRRLGPVLRYLYRVKGIDLENIPKTGGALLLSNHASYADVLLLSLAVGRPIRFVMAKNLYESPYLHWFAKKFGAIPIAHRGAGGTREDTARALAAARAAAEGGELVAIFAEGAMTRHGMLSKFRRGFEDVARDLKAPVIPVYIDGLWGALMSYKPKTLWQRVSRSPKDVTVVAGRPLPQADIPRLYDALMELGARAFAARVESGKEPLAQEFLSAAKSHWLRTAVEESSGRTSYGRLLTSAALLSGRLGPAAPGRGAVAVLLPPSAQAARVNLAIAILGRPAANLPEPADAAALLESMRAAGAARIVATRSDVARRPELASAAERFLFLEDLEADITGPLFWREYARLALRSEDRIRRETFARAAASLDDVAAVVFKTGRSSAAVRLTHRQVQASIEMLREVYTLSRYPKTLGVVPFDRALGYATGFALPFTLGKTAAYPSGPREVGYAARGAGLLVASPEQLEAYTAEVPRRALRSLGLVIAAGAAMPLSSVQAFERRFGKKVLRAYGMAEAAGLVSVNVPYEDRLHANPEKKLVRNRPDTVGHFLPGVAVKLVDPETMEPVGFGAPGLLLLKGANISPDAFATRDGWFVTGDFAAMDKDGYLTLLGPQ